MNNKRRNLLKGGLALGGAAVFGAGYSPKVSEIAKGVMHGKKARQLAKRRPDNNFSYVMFPPRLEMLALSRSPKQQLGAD